MKITRLLKFSSLLFSGFPVFLLSLFLISGAYAQCPVASNCTPGNPSAGNLIFGMGILNVNVNNGAINNSSPANSPANPADGYKDFSCTVGTSLTAAVSYPVSVQTNPNANENVRVWIDYNNDGIFDQINELVFTSNNTKLHTGTFIIPVGAVTGQPLRMRVSADNFSSPIPTPCSTPKYSQVEDYRITVIANTNSPAPEFSASSTTTCSPTVSFTDLSINAPTAWNWNFGDPGSGANNTSTLKNPTHTFSAPGTYTVTLTACNLVGCNTVTKTNYITYHTNVPVAAACTPNTQNYCCGYGITNFNLGAGLLTNTSANGQAGYQDFTCAKAATVIAGNSYNVSLTSGTNPQDTRIYIDLNNDGDFTDPNEMALQILNMVNPAGSLVIPGTDSINMPLRMRVVSDEIGSAFTSCSGIQSGQAEDYTLTITPNPNPPVAQFTSNFATSCDTTIQFTDQSTNAPTSWLWNFGDPASGALNSSTLPNPVHIYHTAGMYTVTLTTGNSNGTNTITKTNYITVVKPCIIYCPVSGINVNLHISNVTLANLNNSSGMDGGGYGNYTNLPGANLIISSTATLSVSRSGNIPISSVGAWIDFNRNGIFETTEKVMSVNGSNTVAASVVQVPATAVLGATRMRVITNGGFTSQNNPCLTNQFNSEIEDYTINILTNLQPPVVDFSANNPITCNGIVQFTDNSVNGAATWLWNFGDPASGANNTSAMQHPTHTYAATGLYSVTLTATNSFGSTTVTKTNYINFDPTNTFCTQVIMPATGTGPTATLCNGSIFDPGGPGGQYADNADSKTTIAPSGAATVTLTFTSFDLENNFDFLEIHDGPDITFPSLGVFTGNTLPNGGTITSTNSALTLHFTSDNIISANGFAATWTCTPVSAPPVANFSADLNSICSGAVAFTDQSTNSPTSWTWDFGDGTPVSSLKNPTHTYATGTAGNFNVTLTACNSFGCNTISKTGYINISVPCLTYCASNGHSNTAQWIKNVQFGTINNTTAANVNGYGNYTNLSNNIMLGTSSPVTVTLGNNNGNFAFITIWIDLNKDGIFQPGERVFNQPAISGSFGNPLIAAGTIAIPSTSVTGSTRMRIIMSQNNNQNDPCVTNLFLGETEDYTVTIQPNTLPTVAQFTANLNTICTGVVQFFNASTNGATSWTWDFGDGSPTSNLQNPTHTYSTTAPGNYTVTLTACKNSVCDTEVKQNFVTITIPCLTYCASAGHNNSNQWISKVEMGTINNSSASDPNGYGNYTFLSNNVILGTGSPISVTLGNNNGAFAEAAIWIDFNKNGTFETTEKVFNGQAVAPVFGNPMVASGTIVIPSTALTGPARMRIIMGQNFNLTNPCLSNQFMGETEDYTVNIQPNTLPTVANFTANLNTICSGPVQFSDASTNGATSWTWDFGDGSLTSNLQNPTHTYSNTTPGSYTVTLTACKNAVCDTEVKTNFINITVPCLTYCASGGHNNSNQWINNVNTGTINNTTSAETNGYGNYTFLNTSVIKGTNTAFSATLGNNNGPTAFVTVWVDLNQNGSFQPAERLFNMQTTGFGGPQTVTGNLAIPAGALTGLTRMRVMMSQNFNQTNACAINMFLGETEDYMINILPNTVPPVVNFSATPAITCNGSVSFTDLSVNNASGWLWNFGDPGSGSTNTSTLQNPTHLFSAPGMYTISLTATNSFGSNTVTKSNFINFDPANTTCFIVNMPVSGPPVTRTTCTGTLFDDGGSANMYSNDADGTVIIAPTGASSVSLTFSSFNTESGFDFLTIHDGPNIASPVLGTFDGTTLPNGGLPIVSTGGIMTIHFTSDNIINSSGFEATWSCTTPPVAPVADFTGTPTTTCDGFVAFTNTSANNPTSWSWSFGDPASGAANTSTLQNPTHTFSAPGIYSVSLTACNSFGCNTKVLSNYINYSPGSLTCLTTKMPTNGTNILKTGCTGILTDDGGQAANYSNNADGSVTIAPAGATQVVLTFSSFNTESGFDFLKIYDGNSTSATLIGTYTGSNLPGQPILSSGNALTVQFTSDNGVNMAGFEAAWSCITGAGKEVKADKFNLYPNPTTGLVTISKKEASTEKLSIEITDAIGKVIRKGMLPFTGNQELQLDLRALPKGIYLLKILGAEAIYSKKLVKE